MRYLLDHLDAVQELLTLRPLGLITDIDGTISDIAATPEAAVVSPICREKLADLTQRLEVVAAISGRPAAAARDMVGVDGMVYVGNHGLERWRDGAVEYVAGAEKHRAKVKEALERIRAMLPLECIILEDKGVSLSIHYRLCPDVQEVRQLVLSKVATVDVLTDFRVCEGKMVVELRPAIDVGKGVAVRSLVERYKLRSGLYLGDDVTDTDAFEAMHEGGFRGAAIAVLGEESPDGLRRSADFTLNGVSDVERFLAWLAATSARPA